MVLLYIFIKFRLLRQNKILLLLNICEELFYFFEDQAKSEIFTFYYFCARHSIRPFFVWSFPWEISAYAIGVSTTFKIII